MATPTLTPNDQSTDEHNPAQQLYDREFNDIAGNYAKSADPSQENRNIDSLRDAERTGSTPATQTRELKDTVAGKAATTAAATTGPIGTTAVKLIGKIKTKKGGIGTAIVGVLIGIVILLATFLGPGLLIVQIKETLADKFNDTLAAMDARTTLIIKKKLGATSGICTKNIKVMCRFDGFSKKQVAALERAGVKLDKKGTTTFGKTKVASLTMPDGSVMTAGNVDTVLRDSPDTRRVLNRAFNPRYVAFSDKVFGRLATSLDLTKQKRISGTTDEELRKSLENSAKGVDENGERVGRVAVSQVGDEFFDQDGNKLSAAEAAQIKQFNADLDASVSSLEGAGKQAVVSVAKSTALVGLSGGLAAGDGLCTGYYIIQTVGYGSKILAAQQLIRYSWIWMNTADAIKAGDATDKEVGYLGKKATSVNKYGESFTDSFLYKYAAHGSLAMPVGKDLTETSERRGAITQFALGGGISGTLLDFNRQLNAYTGGNTARFCSGIKNPASQIGLLAGSILLTVASGGTNLASGAIVAGTVSAGLGLVMAVALPKLINMSAQKLVTGDTKSADAGNAVVAGFGALNAMNARSHALSPLKKSNVLEYTNRTNRIAAEYKAAEVADASPWDITNSASPAYHVATTLNSQLGSASSLMKNPTKIFGNAVSGIFSSTVSAANDPLAEYDMCEDEEYNKADYAADPACNIRYGLSGAEMELDPEVVTKWMYDNDMITDDGEPQGGSDYQTYLEECVFRTQPIGSTGQEGQEDDGSLCSEQNQKERYFRIFYLDASITDSMDEEPVAADPEIPQIPNSAGNLATGTDQELAKKILSSGNVTGDSRYMSQIRAYAAGDFKCNIDTEILQLIASIATKYEIRISSLNRYCTGVLTDSGVGSAHYGKGGGHAVDINYVNGIHATGSTAVEIAMIKEFVTLLPPQSAVGQRQCRASKGVSITLPNIRQHDDTCHHTHISVPF